MGTNNKEQQNNESIADKLFPIVLGDVELFQDSFGSCYAVLFRRFEGQEHETEEVVAIPSVQFDRFIRRLYLEETGKTIGNEHISKISETMLMLAHEPDIEQYPVFSRVAQNENVFFYNIDNSRTARISAEGVQILPFTTKETFLLPSISKQVKPRLKTKPQRLLPLMAQIFRVSPNDLFLLAIWLCTCFIRNISHPILVLSGSPGSAKSSSLKALSLIVDANKNCLMKLPKDEKSQIAVLTNCYFVAFDNLRELSEDASDMMCLRVTGGTYVARKLYTDSDMASGDIKGIICIAGIEKVATQKDLLDRAITIESQRIPDDEVMPEEDFLEIVKKKTPAILGSIFNILSKAIEIREKTQVTPSSRLADFAKWGYCI